MNKSESAKFLFKKSFRSIMVNKSDLLNKSKLFFALSGGTIIYRPRRKTLCGACLRRGMCGGGRGRQRLGAGMRRVTNISVGKWSEYPLRYTPEAKVRSG